MKNYLFIANRISNSSLVLVLMILLFVLVCIHPYSAVADSTFDAGMTRYNLKDYRGAHDLWVRAANQHDPRAEYALGSMSHNGLVVEQSDIDAAKWWRLAAQRGYAKAQVSLGHLYRIGSGVPTDHGKAFALYKEAAYQGDAEGQTNLASMFLDGTGTERNVDTAIGWYSKAAEQNYTLAQQLLGMVFHNIKKDDITAAKWWSRASERGDADAQYNLALLYIAGSGVPQDERKALFLITLAAQQGHAEAKKWHNRFLDIQRNSTGK